MQIVQLGYLPYNALAAEMGLTRCPAISMTVFGLGGVLEEVGWPRAVSGGFCSKNSGAEMGRRLTFPALALYTRFCADPTSICSCLYFLL